MLILNKEKTDGNKMEKAYYKFWIVLFAVQQHLKPSGAWLAVYLCFLFTFLTFLPLISVIGSQFSAAETGTESNLLHTDVNGVLLQQKTNIFVC